MLRSYRGALMVVSHDDAFMDNPALKDRLVVNEKGLPVGTVVSPSRLSR
ncbi:hypothetical protein M1D55_11285 [Cupriavidus sp. JZ107]